MARRLGKEVAHRAGRDGSSQAMPGGGLADTMPAMSSPTHSSSAAAAVFAGALRVLHLLHLLHPLHRLPRRRPHRLRAAVPVALAVLATMMPAPTQAQPARLSQTGFFAPAAARAAAAQPQPAADLVTFTPQYALWSDGATKRRWLRLPPGTTVDKRDADAWRFPPGTQLWKEFAVGGRPVETRYIERRRDGRWLYATYAWNADGSDADLVPARGVRAWPLPGAADAPGGTYALPSLADCQACHESAAVPVLGFSAVQLASARSSARSSAHSSARIAAADDTERAALGYLHANCGHCHNRSGNQAPVPLTLAQRAADPEASRAEVLASTLDVTRSRLVQRMATRDPRRQMPPIGTAVPDADGLALLRRWITQQAPARTTASASTRSNPHQP